MSTFSADAPQVALVPVKELHPAEWNPRTIRDERFKNLCQSLEADPDFLWRRPVLANRDGVVMAGNMRLRAALHLKWTEIPAIVEDVPEKLAKERALRDNAQWGDWNNAQLAEMVYSMAADGSDVKLVGLDEEELAKLLGIVPDFQPVGEDEQGRLDQKKPVTCPECGHEFVV